MARRPSLTFEGIVHAVSAKAVLFQCHFWWAPMWLPRSQIEVIEDPEGNERIVRVSDWLARQDRLEEFTELTLEEVQDRSQWMDKNVPSPTP